jgi:hypothetical protein
MSYENSFAVSLLKNPTLKRKVNQCPTCNTNFGEDVTFCNKDGSELTPKVIDGDVSDVIKKFKKYTDEGHLIKKNGKSAMTGSGRDFESDLVEFSKKYPDGIFQVYGIPDSGFQEPDYKLYIKNGKSHQENATYVFEPYNESKLK